MFALQLRGILPLAGWHAHAAVCVGMLGAAGRSMPGKQRAGHNTPVTETMKAVLVKGKIG